MNFLKSHLLVLILPVVLFTSCGKGYEVRFTNYYTEPIDSVVIGENKLVLKDVELQDDTDYYALSKGKYSVQIISKTKKRFCSIPCAMALCRQRLAIYHCFWKKKPVKTCTASLFRRRWFKIWAKNGNSSRPSRQPLPPIFGKNRAATTCFFRVFFWLPAN